MTETETPNVMCPCGKEMKVKNQEMLKQGRINLDYVCECGNTANILLFEEQETYNEIIKDKNGKVLRLDTKSQKTT